jgi:hypothetical protein
MKQIEENLETNVFIMPQITQIFTDSFRGFFCYYNTFISHFNL